MFTKFLRVIGICLLFGIFIMVSNVTAKEKKYVFKVASLLSAPSTHGVSLDKFAKAVEAESDGKIKINVSHHAVLGSGRENIEQIRMGTIEMAMLFYNFMGSLDKRFPAEDLPFVWSRRWQAYAAYNGELGDIYERMAEKYGIKVLGYYDVGYRCITNNIRPIYKPEDLKGIKIRVAEIPIRLATFKTLHASAIPIAFGELYTALQLGTVDAQETPLPMILSSKFYEVQKYLSITKHIWSNGVLAINKNIWEKLPENYQKILQRNALKYAYYNNHLVIDTERVVADKLASLGMKVNQVDPKPFIKATEPVLAKYAPIFGKEIMDSIKKYTTDY